MVIYAYMVGEFDTCTEFCGGVGNQTREVDCYLVIDGMLNVTVDDEDCTAFGLTRPEDTRSCNDRPCPNYLAAEFGMVRTNTHKCSCTLTLLSLAVFPDLPGRR